MRTMRRSKVVAVAVSAVLVVGLLTGCLRTEVRDHAVVGPPEAGVTAFGQAIAMDEHRLVVRALRDGGPVVYVYDAEGDGWSHSATITPFFGSTPDWGLALGVSGDTIAIADRSRPGAEDEEYGAVQLFEEVTPGAWNYTQVLVGGEPAHSFGRFLELSGDGLVVTWTPSCQSYACEPAKWVLYQDYGGRFRPVFTEYGTDLDLGGDAGRLVVGTPGRIDPFAGSQDNRLRVIDANVVLPRFVVDERVPVATDDIVTEERYRKVDLAGDVLAFDHCCATDQRLHIRTWDGSTYVEAATFPLDGYARWLSVLPGLVLLADVGAGVWHAYAAHEDGWQKTNDVPAPDAVAGQFLTEPVAAGDRIAVRGDGVVHVLTLEVVDTRAT